MIKSAILNLLIIFPLGAANYIDNPNFDNGVDGWSNYRHGEPLSWYIVPYHEHTRDGVILDQYCRLLPTYKGGGVFDFEGRRNRPGTFIYKMSSAPLDMPLHFVVEVGYSGQGPVLVQVFVDEVIEKENPRPPTPQGWRYPPIKESQILSKKAKIIDGQTSWHSIISDYPGYKKQQDSAVFLRVFFSRPSSDSVPALENYPYTNTPVFLESKHHLSEVEVQLNYAQVGTDPKSLGGRGARKKNFNKRDEL